MENRITAELITVIIPVYRQDNTYLKKCLDSIVKQTYPHTEIIIVNDGMTEDNTELINHYLNSYDNVRLIGDKNEGVSSARNKGVDAANGEWLAFIDSDDWIDEDYLEQLYKAATDHDAEIVICGHKRVYGSYEEIIVKNKSFALSSQEFLKNVLNVQNCFGFSWSKLYKKSLFSTNIRFNKDVSIAEDALIQIDLCKKTERIFYVALPLYYYRFNDNSTVREFKTNYVDIIAKSMTEAQRSLDSASFSYNKKDFYNYIAYHVLLILVNYCCHPENPDRGVSCIKATAEIPIFKEAILRSDYRDLSSTRKITLFTLKKKLYYLSYLIGAYRQMQFRKQKLL